jgi:TIGR03009 family protein
MRIHFSQPAIAGLVLCLSTAIPVAAQQQVTPLQPTGQRPLMPGTQPPIQPQAQAQAPAAALPAQPPAGFQLNQLQLAMLNQVLNVWQAQSAKINTFKCSFERWEYNKAFGPKVDNEEAPLNKCAGVVSYSRPDKGSFQITEIRPFKLTPAAPGQAPGAPAKGDWVKDPNAIGEHWVCDGEAIYEYRHHQKQLVERTIPPQLRGQAIVDGPLPFLFGADAAKLKARYWLRVEQQQDPSIVWITARPRFKEQAADFSKVEVMLDRERLLPRAMQVHLPDESRHVYMFDIANASVNDRLAVLKSFFERPRVPYGYKRVVEQMPMAQAAVRDQPPR